MRFDVLRDHAVAAVWRAAGAAAIVVGLWGAAPAVALAEDPGIPLTVRVIDRATGAPVPTAVVRHPQEQDRHRVNTETGESILQVLYMPDGSELVLEKGLTIDLEVSAPGYLTQSVSYTMRKRKNAFDVGLEKMEIDMTDEAPEDIVIPFIRDKPIE